MGQRRLYLIVPLAAVLGVIVDLIVWNHGCDLCNATRLTWSVAITALAVAVAVVIAASAGCIIRRMVRRGGRLRVLPSRGLLSAAITLGLLLAAPVQLNWDDGCNEHWSTVVAAEAPYVLASRPESTIVAPYESIHTLVGCG